MASTYVNDLRLNEMATGDGSGTWGTTTNTNLELIAEAFSYGTEVITTNADTHTTTIADGATDPGRSLYLKYTGTLDSACTITIGPNTVSKVWIIENGTSGSQNIIISQGSGANITIPAGDTKVVYSDGAGAGAAFFDAFASLSVVDLKVQDDLTVTDAALVTGVLTTTATQVATGGITSGSDIISDTDSTDSLGSTGVRWLKGWFDTLTAGTLTVGSGSVTDSSGAISFGDENLTTTGIVTAAGTSVFTNLDISGDIDVDGTTNLDVVDIDGALTQDGGAVFNEASADVDFRVESDNDANALFVQGSDGNVGIGTSSPNSKTHIVGAANAIALRVTNAAVDGNDADVMHIEPSNGAYVGKLLRIQSGRSDFSDSLLFLNTTTGMNGTNGSYMRVQNNLEADIFRIKGDGNVGIGTGSPAAKLHIESAATNEAIRINTSTGYNAGINYYVNDTIKWTAQVLGDGTDAYRFYNFVAASEAMRIDSSGNLLVGTTNTANIATHTPNIVTDLQYGINDGSNIASFGLDRISFNSSNYFVLNASATGVKLVNGATSWTTQSDENSKENIVELSGVLTAVNAMRCVRYNLKSQTSDDVKIGFIAQDWQSSYPEVVATDTDGTLGMNYTETIPVLLKAIQEQNALIEALTTRITALEG
jgi:hypothetical protein